MNINSALIVCLCLCFSALSAWAQSYTSETRDQIAQFPDEGGTLDWSLLSDALRTPDGDSAFEDVYTSILIGLRTDRIDLLPELMISAKSKAETPAHIAQISLVDAFLQFYLYQPENRSALFDHILDRLDDLDASGAPVDWMTGTTIGALNEHALQTGNLVLAEQTSALAEHMFSRQPKLETAIWVANLNLKAVYAAMPSPGPQASGTVDRLLSRATNFLDQANRRDTEQTYADEITGLYYRTVAVNLYLNSRAHATDKQDAPRSVRLLLDLHPKFETECVIDLKSSRRKIRSRILSGTGGVLLRLSIDKKGRAKFVQVEDAVPIRLAHEKMHRSYRTIANELRASLKDMPECTRGGEILHRISISGAQ